MTKMKLILLIVVISIMSLTSVAFANFTTSEATFTSNLAPGYYLEDFSAYNNYGYLSSPIAFSGGSGFSYSISSPGGLYATTGSISTLNNSDPILITFTGAPVKAVGGQFFLTDYYGNDMNGTVKVTLSDGSWSDVTMSDLTRPFLGYSSNLSIASLSINSIRPDTQDTYYPTVDHLYVGSQVPIPAAVWLLGTGLVGLFGVRRRFMS